MCQLVINWLYIMVQTQNYILFTYLKSCGNTFTNIEKVSNNSRSEKYGCKTVYTTLDHVSSVPLFMYLYQGIFIKMLIVLSGCGTISIFIFFFVYLSEISTINFFYICKKIFVLRDVCQMKEIPIKVELFFFFPKVEIFRFEPRIPSL